MHVRNLDLSSKLMKMQSTLLASAELIKLEKTFSDLLLGVDLQRQDLQFLFEADSFQVRQDNSLVDCKSEFPQERKSPSGPIKNEVFPLVCGTSS